MQQIYARQGDLVIHKLENMDPQDLVKETDAILAGSTGSEHVIKGTAQVRRDSRRTVFQIAEPTQIVHGSRHLSTTLEPGTYEVRKLRERGNGEDREVED